MKLIFVYNADSGPISGLFDIGHKIISPGSYSCGLCFASSKSLPIKSSNISLSLSSAIIGTFKSPDTIGICHPL